MLKKGCDLMTDIISDQRFIQIQNGIGAITQPYYFSKINKMKYIWNRLSVD